MGNHKSGGEESHHVIQEGLLETMLENLSSTPRLLRESAGDSNCCIFRVPQSLMDTNGRAYQPHIVSIGPFHHGKPHLQTIEEHKWRFLRALLNRTQSKGLDLEDYLKAIQPLEMKARECYSETIHLDPDKFIMILVLDGCFIIELFRTFGKLIDPDPKDPLLTMSWVYLFFLRDLIRMENQIPFFILQRLFDLSVMPREETGPSLKKLALLFFNNTTQRPVGVIERYNNNNNDEVRHLLDLLRSSFIPPPDLDEPKSESTDLDEPEPDSTLLHDDLNLIQCISNLRRAGIKLKTGKDDSFLVVKYRPGMIEMPMVAIDDFMSYFMINCVAFEQCQKDCSKHFTTYATLLNCLINTPKDVEFLLDQKIIENYLGTNDQITKFINDLVRDASFDIKRCYLANLFENVNTYCKKEWHVQWAGFRYTYFNSPWSFISASAAVVLLGLTVLQTVYTVLGYY